jgi:large subunit ribosomal protein L9
MKVIFTANVPGVASKGDSKNVKNGFFRNYLLPQGKALLATPNALKEWEERRKKILIEKENLKTQVEEMKRRVAGSKIKIEKKVTKKGTLYGGVKAADIAKAIKDFLKLEIPETAIVMKEPIKAVGSFEVTLNLGEGIETSLPIEVVEKA